MLSVCACRRSRWSPGLPSCLERVPSYLLFSSPSSSPTTTDWPTSRPAPPASPAAPPRLTLRTPALWPRPPVTRRTSSHSYRTAACDWQLARPITAQKPELCLLVPPPFRINGYQLLFLFFTFLQVQTVDTKQWSGVWRRSHWRALFTLMFTSCLFNYRRVLRCVHVLFGRRHCLSGEVTLQTLLCSRASSWNFCFLSLRAFKQIVDSCFLYLNDNEKSKNNGSRCLRVVATTWESVHVSQKLFQLFHSTWTHKWYISQNSRLICSVLFWFCDDRLSHIIIAI